MHQPILVEHQGKQFKLILLEDQPSIPNLEFESDIISVTTPKRYYSVLTKIIGVALLLLSIARISIFQEINKNGLLILMGLFLLIIGHVLAVMRSLKNQLNLKD